MESGGIAPRVLCQKYRTVTEKSMVHPYVGVHFTKMVGSNLILNTKLILLKSYTGLFIYLH